MISWLRTAGRWLWAIGAAIAAVAWMVLAARARSQQARHDRRLEDLENNASAGRRQKIDSEVAAARKAAETAKARRERAEKSLDAMAKADPDMADLLRQYDAARVPKRTDAP